MVARPTPAAERLTPPAERPMPAAQRPTLAYEPASPRRLEIISERPTPRSPRKRSGGPLEDTAVYSCQCGYVFEASVSTTVGCPHCGHTQAW